MSSVTFTSEHTSAAIRGWERAHAGGVTSDLAAGLLNLRYHAAEVMARTPVCPDYVHDLYRRRTSDRVAPFDFVDSFMTCFHLGGAISPMTFRVDDREATAFQVQLNTAMVVGNDVTRFLARLHAQCELHGWVAEANRPWLADIIDEGRRTGLMRPGAGWEQVAELLRNGDGGPVVTWDSGGGSFPDRYECGWEAADGTDDEEAEETWDALPAAERWALGVAKLRTDAEWSPERHSRPHFGGGLTVFDLTRAPDAAEGPAR